MGERVQRRLAVVIATDIAGYSRLMAAVEEGTIWWVNRLGVESVNLTIDAYRDGWSGNSSKIFSHPRSTGILK
jgi:hypothetical protein